MASSIVSCGPHLFNSRDGSSSRHHARGRGCKERQNTTTGAGMSPFKLVDLEPNPLLQQQDTDSPRLSLGHLFNRTQFCSCVHMFLPLSGKLLRAVQALLNDLDKSGQVGGAPSQSQPCPTLALGPLGLHHWDGGLMLWEAAQDTLGLLVLRILLAPSGVSSSKKREPKWRGEA